MPIPRRIRNRFLRPVIILPTRARHQEFSVIVFCFTIKMNDQKINFLLNHSEPTPLNFFIRFKFRSKKAAIEASDPSSKKLLDLKGRLDMGGYKKDWTRYEDWKIREIIEKQMYVFYIRGGWIDCVQDGYYERSGDESGQGSEVDDNLSREETQASYPTIHERTNEQANNYNVQ
ncbi:hypothetical protein C1646_666746 [Rhizophagus diaphanus]|nr:hypothetical protein C1646_666746 [Rhizophagus diaphanus] [Rhizophagus sp. MUCL 43196]